MKTSKIVIISLITVFLGIVLFLCYMGFCSKRDPVEKEEGGFVVIGLDLVGPYSKVGQYMKKTNKQLKELGINSSKQIGVYYDSPALDSNRCHSLIGVIIEREEIKRIKEKDIRDFRIDSIPKRDALVLEFPMKSKLSYMFGPAVVYPAFSKYMKEKAYKGLLSFEIYDYDKGEITYVMQYNKLPSQ
ncbi:MAG TPA: GyrI-like domain-containing protein [Bacteroidia bacterium]|nr:GyrI-like domain-containing protein [Bacteroidia bacterium]